VTRPFLSGERPLAFAHRGGGALWPENTLVAFQGAIELGIQYLETDVHLTRDGHVVVFHDAGLERTTNGHGLVRDHTLGELRALDAAYRFSPDGKTFPWRGKGVRIPRFEELVDLDANVRLNVELKQPGVGLERAFFELCEEHALFDRVLVAAAEHAIARRFRALSRGRIAQSASAREVLGFWLAVRARVSRAWPISYDALQVPVRQSGLTVVDASFLNAAHARGLHVHVWTIDDPEEMRRLVALGVDGLMSDRPDRLLSALR
jgi:glycerophosphoryl diester phosphodiesterase